LSIVMLGRVMLVPRVFWIAALWSVSASWSTPAVKARTTASLMPSLTVIAMVTVPISLLSAPGAKSRLLPTTTAWDSATGWPSAPGFWR
jgi:hypothetical protein